MKYIDYINVLKDTRPFATSTIKSELLLYVKQILSSNDDSKKQYEALLLNKIINLFSRNDLHTLSTTLSFVPNRDYYNVLWKALDKVMLATINNPIQWLIWPLVMVVGSKQRNIIPLEIPTTKIISLLKFKYDNKTIDNLYWYPYLIDSDSFSNITANIWFNSMKSIDDANTFLSSLKHPKKITINPGKEVLIFYIITYGNIDSQIILNKPLGELALPIMQLWIEFFSKKDGSIFINPHIFNTPPSSLIEADRIKRHMQFEIFVSDAIRKIRLYKKEPYITIYTKDSGIIAIIISDLEEIILKSQFNWELTFADDIASILSYILGLLIECKITHIKILREPIKNDYLVPYNKINERDCYILK